MIVVCTNCQAKFRIADEKIGPRGAKVRCSRCQTVFVADPEAAAFDAAAGPGAPAEPPGSFGYEDPFAPAPERSPGLPEPRVPTLPGIPPPLPFSQPPGLSEDDPFGIEAAARAAPEAAPLESAPAAPSRAVATAPAAWSEAPPLESAPAAPPPQDPLAPLLPGASPQDPFAPATVAGEGAAPGLALTDLSDLLGAPSAPPPVPPPLPLPDDLGLALEERHTPQPMRVGGGVSRTFDDLEAVPPPPLDPFAGPDGRAFDAASFDGDPFPGSGALSLPDEPAPGPPPMTPAAGFEPPGFEPPATADAASSARPPTGEQVAPPTSRDEGRARWRRASRLRSVVVNAVALAALLAIALALLAVWRSKGPFEAGSLRPAAIVAALRGGRSASAFEAADLRSGVYERSEGPPVLFVRGTVVSRAAAPVGKVAVAVEIVRDGTVVARGEALAGGVPTPEELWRAKDAAALAEVARSASARARQVRPGESVPFLVAIGDRPPDLEGASLRVDVRPAAARER